MISIGGSVEKIDCSTGVAKIWDKLCYMDLEQVLNIAENLEKLVSHKPCLVSFRVPATEIIVANLEDNLARLSDFLRGHKLYFTRPILEKLFQKYKYVYIWWDGGTNYVVEVLII